MRKYNLYLLFVAMILLIGCTTHIETEPLLNNDQLVLPESTANHIKAYRRFNVNPKFIGNWNKTNINIDKGDMLLIFAEGKNTKSVSMCGNLLLTIGESSPQYAAVNELQNRDFSNACNGYFMSHSSGEIKFGFRQKSKGYYTVDLFVISESDEKYLLQTLKDLVDINFDDELFLSQAMSFIENNNWIFYTQLDVTSSPSNAKVYIDDEFKGNTPLKIDKIIKHDARNICIKLDNYSEYCNTFIPKNKSRFYVDLKELQNKFPASTSVSLIDNIESEIKGKENNYSPTQLVQDKFYFGEYHALVIGNNYYNILPKLNTAVNDAQAIASVLQNQYAYKVNLILNGTRREILSSLDKLRG
ncbi:MAG: PEGA domain-containing protein, partial [Desulfobacterales bacterium]|nr:PEGA domain-containing protein [Desulfobacterales bacterium]